MNMGKIINILTIVKCIKNILIKKNPPNVSQVSNGNIENQNSIVGNGNNINQYKKVIIQKKME